MEWDLKHFMMTFILDIYPVKFLCILLFSTRCDRRRGRWRGVPVFVVCWVSVVVYNYHAPEDTCSGAGAELHVRMRWRTLWRPDNEKEGPVGVSNLHYLSLRPEWDFCARSSPCYVSTAHFPPPTSEGNSKSVPSRLLVNDFRRSEENCSDAEAVMPVMISIWRWLQTAPPGTGATWPSEGERDICQDALSLSATHPTRPSSPSHILQHFWPT